MTEQNSDIVIDHNIYYCEDAFGNRVSLGLIVGDAMYVDPSSPRALVATGALLARGYDTYSGWDGSFIALPNSNQTTHRLNLWAKSRGEVAAWAKVDPTRTDEAFPRAMNSLFDGAGGARESVRDWSGGE